MFVSLSPQTEKMGERMNGVMNHRRGGVFQKVIRRTDPVITLAMFSLAVEAVAALEAMYICKNAKELIK